jgi:O-antigen ligase
MAIIYAPRLEHKIFWPVMGLIAITQAFRHWSRLTFPPHIKCLFAYLAFAGVSVLWSFKPEFSSIRFIQQAMIIASIVLPALLTTRGDMMRGVFICFAFALIINMIFVINQPPFLFNEGRIAYTGYFTFKGILGECGAMAILLSLHEILYPGWRRVSGIVICGLATYVVVISDSKGSLGIVVLAPLLAWLTLFIGKKIRASPAGVLWPVPVLYTLLSFLVSNLINRISWYVDGNYTLSGRAFIWLFANSEIARKPIFGWGYQSFWLVGPDAPSIVDAPGWIKSMPSSHNGYLDTMVDMGYIGIILLVAFIFATLHAIGRVAVRDRARAWLLLTLSLYVILTNFIETGWLRGMDMLWVIFLIVAAEAGRNWGPSVALGKASRRLGPAIGGQRRSLAQVHISNKFIRFQSGGT